MRVVDGQASYTDTENRDIDLAEDELDRIEALKESLTEWLDRAKYIYGYFPAEFHNCKVDEFGDYKKMFALFEEEFNELFHEQWRKQWQICRTPYRESIPTIEALRMKLKTRREARDIEARLREANMAEAKKQGLV